MTRYQKIANHAHVLWTASIPKGVWYRAVPLQAGRDANRRNRQLEQEHQCHREYLDIRYAYVRALKFRQAVHEGRYGTGEGEEYARALENARTQCRTARRRYHEARALARKVRPRHLRLA